ncbi:abortive infection family protein [Desulfococcus multivorans]|uniref:Abortive infection protein-like, C-terminal domain containing protein n=1 Tax=Desulfococcus multivorans DSM 2059 TaxID=1121405 RepID=S7TQZ8_DESML|nr:abortive infection family protein [Desulfococcus multivorans]AOY57271.1 uncharacterized protein Dmul_04960 [Desulfococcus multivorans]AQU99722.1 hypothetical protein B2D07_02310 [Desulfococcus multivorans]EPR39085.1 Abortive infection protein-like, C-terminal domain containing protein [Desulfococcus multivorans DSM 2059]SKA30035.1 Abortive infection C-terminus [Desulfococcus multivorans DSM 2059]
MSQDLISKKTRNEFREYFVSKTLREIQMEFDATDVHCDLDYIPQVSGQRRTLVEQYFHTVNWKKWTDVKKVLKVFENVLSKLEGRDENSFPDNNEWAQSTFASLRKWVERDGYRYSDGRLLPVGRNQALQGVADTVSAFDLPELHRQVDRMQNAIERDPGLAIGTAKELLETTCKTILLERKIAFAENEDLSKLIKNTRKALGLVPESVPYAAKGADIIRRLLNNLGTVAQGLSELRNLYGTGHGKDGQSRGLGPRHAKLAVGAASTLATFLFETHLERDL